MITKYKLHSWYKYGSTLIELPPFIVIQDILSYIQDFLTSHKSNTEKELKFVVRNEDPVIKSPAFIPWLKEHFSSKWEGPGSNILSELKLSCFWSFKIVFNISKVLIN